MAGIFLSTLAILALLLCAVAGSPPPVSGHGSAGEAGGETDTPAHYFSQGPFADDPAGSDVSASAALTNKHHHHYTQPLYRIDTVEDFHRLAEGVNEHSRAEAAKLEECWRRVSELREVCYTHICTPAPYSQQPNAGDRGGYTPSIGRNVESM